MLSIYGIAIVVFGLFLLREVILDPANVGCNHTWAKWAFSINAVSFAALLLSGLVFGPFVGKIGLIDLPHAWGPVGRSIVIFIVATFLAYWWHRLVHASDTLWRSIHQLHHSPARVEVLTAFYLHPLESMAAVALNGFVAYVIFGATPLEAALSILYFTLSNLLAHTPMRTPHWLGYLTQRPEMHRLHHERGVHKRNYGLPLWDIAFGTFENPRTGKVTCGFAAENEFRVPEMLMMKKVED